jgi:hypothetical protein
MLARLRLSPSLTRMLLVAVLLLRAAVPSGWMPVAEQGGIRITLCTGSGQQFMVMDRNGALHKEVPQPSAPRDPCPYALAAAQLADVPPVIEIRFPPAKLEPLTFPDLAHINAALRRNPLPPARGPPAFV